MKKLIIVSLIIYPFFLQAQNFRDLDKSPMDQAKYPVSNRVTEKTAIITYSRPQLNERSFQEIVPINKVWRTGANEATEIRLFKQVKIGETILQAGTYTIFTIPYEEEITFVINSATNIWGSYSYNSKNDILRIQVPLTKSKKSLEAFSIAFSEKNDQPKIHFGWEYVRFEIPFNVL